jgi:NADPH-dependent 2,4-dienoyl-CoA reductase/sulfur reductase-like enzyme
MTATDSASVSRKAVVIGAGPVGCLAALALAKRGFSVELYEGRPGGLRNILWLHLHRIPFISSLVYVFQTYVYRHQRRLCNGAP